MIKICDRYTLYCHLPIRLASEKSHQYSDIRRILFGIQRRVEEADTKLHVAYPRYPLPKYYGIVLYTVY